MRPDLKFKTKKTWVIKGDIDRMRHFANTLKDPVELEWVDRNVKAAVQELIRRGEK